MELLKIPKKIKSMFDFADKVVSFKRVPYGRESSAHIKKHDDYLVTYLHQGKIHNTRISTQSSGVQGRRK